MSDTPRTDAAISGAGDLLGLDVAKLIDTSRQLERESLQDCVDRLTAENLDYDVALTQERERTKALSARLEAAEGIVVGLAGLGGPVSDTCTPESIWTMIERARAHVAQSAKAQEGKDKANG
jgi:hypothetical protein